MDRTNWIIIRTVLGIAIVSCTGVIISVVRVVGCCHATVVVHGIVDEMVIVMAVRGIPNGVVIVVGPTGLLYLQWLCLVTIDITVHHCFSHCGCC